jgi:signal transduction histidine kinase
MQRLAAENTRLRKDLARSAALMRRADQLASLGVLTAGLAHEIRNPLVAMRAFAQLLPERWEDPEFRREFARVAVAEVDRVEALVRELLRLAHESARDVGAAGAYAPGGTTAPAAARVTLSTIAEAVLPLLRVQARHKGVDLAFESGDALAVAAAPLRLRQVVMNLVLNAIDATPEGGSIAIVCGSREDGGEQRALLCVHDSGPGIAPDDLPRIFEPFFTTRDDGTGLGLAITRDIVEACGGAIRVESGPGAGATFIVELPAGGSSVAPRAAVPARR